jgi:hypothetical protein
MLPSVVVPNIHVPVGRRELLWRGPGLQGFPSRLELRFAARLRAPETAERLVKSAWPVPSDFC